ncbi:hypothetical protein A5893_03725 [Pedobacter psychrophilus]|uniref:Methyltransferase FkbM domain-containing protein n=1 Tax=Pedobacter psychrophilus TaxID=1826909 RepID=A0A179DNY5_9SPHI|nr:hypothetical protein A5893_03725 [Pedobacter psychrophilus]
MNDFWKKNIINGLKILFQFSIFKKAFFFIKVLNKNTDLFNNQHQAYLFKNKIHFNLNLYDWIQCQLFFLNRYEDFELNVVEDILEKGDNCIDIGANFGLYSLCCAYIVGNNGKVISFEPYYENYKVLETNLKLNKFTNVQLVKLAVSDKNSILNLYYNGNIQNLGMVSSYNFDESAPIKVFTITIDEFLLINKIESLKFIKIDIEGGEYLALKGMINTLKELKPIIQIEIDDEILANTPYKSSDIHNFFKENNYELYMPQLKKQKKLLRLPYSKNYYFKSRS